MEIRKIYDYCEENVELFSEKAEGLLADIKRNVDHITLETVISLAELCYYEGFNDGYRLADWISEKTR